MTSKDTQGVLIGIGNQKGGVGKSTATVHLAAALGEAGHRTLVIDLDPSAGATRHLGVRPDDFHGTLELICGDDGVTALAVSEGMPTNVSLIPARSQLSELELRMSKFTDKTVILDRACNEARGQFDFILLDTPPNPAAVTTVAAYSSADWFLLTVFPHPLSLSGLNEALKDIADVRTRRNPRLEVMGVLLNAVDARTRLWQEVAQVVESALPGKLFQTHISQSIEVAKAAGTGRTLFQLVANATLQRGRDTDHRVVHQYRELAREVLWRATCRDEYLRQVSSSNILVRGEPWPSH